MDGRYDWFDVEAFGDGWYQILEGDPVLPCYMYALEAGGDAILVDTGLGIGDIEAVVRDAVGPDVRVLLTHSHWDHLGAGHRFERVSIHDSERRPDGVVAIDVLSDDYDERPGQFIQEWQESGHEFPDGFDPSEYHIEPIRGVEALDPDGVVHVGDRELDIVPTPGHSPGHVAVLDRDAGICHGADIMEPGGEVYAHFQTSDIRTYQESIERLIGLRDDGAYDTLTIGHGEPLRGDELELLDDIADALERITADAAQFDVVDTPWGPRRRYRVGDVEVLAKDERSGP